MTLITTCANCGSQFQWDETFWKGGGMPDCPACGFNNHTGRKGKGEGPIEQSYRSMARDLVKQYGNLQRVEYLSHYPDFKILFVFDKHIVYSGRRRGEYDINFLSLGYVGEGPRYAQAFLDELGFSMTTDEIAAINPGAVIKIDNGKVIVQQKPAEEAILQYGQVPDHSLPSQQVVRSANQYAINQAAPPSNQQVAITAAPQPMTVAGVEPSKTRSPSSIRSLQLTLIVMGILLMIAVIAYLVLWKPVILPLLAKNTPPGKTLSDSVNAPAGKTLSDSVNAPPGMLLFVSDRGGNNDIYLMNSSGGDPVNLTRNPSDDSNPTWSPDFQKIAFTSNRDNSANLEFYLMNADGSDPTRLTTNGEGFGHFAFSPDGQKIAYSSFDPLSTDLSSMTAVQTIYIMNSDGTNRIQLTTNRTFMIDMVFSWSPDGLKITYVSIRDGIYGIYQINSDGSGEKALTNNYDYYFNYSRDDKKIVFTSQRDGNPEIYVMNADGSNQTRLTNNPSDDNHPIWSPDRRKIAFLTDRDGNSEIYLMNADGSAQTNLTNNQGLDGFYQWSLDGHQVSFTSDRDGNYEIYLINADGSKQTRLTNSLGVDIYAVWSPAISPITYAEAHTPIPTTNPTLTHTPKPTLTPLTTRTSTAEPALVQATSTLDASLPFQEVFRYSAYDISFIIEASTADLTNPAYFLRTEGGTDDSSNRYGVGEFSYVSTSFPAHYITEFLAEDLSSAVLDDGTLAAGINPEWNPETESIDLAFLTQGEIAWCGLSFSARSAQDQMVFLQTLKASGGTQPWALNVPDTWFMQLPQVEERGWFEELFLGVVSPDSTQSTVLAPTLVLNGSAKYTLSILPSAIIDLGGDSTILSGLDHEYLVQGYVCQIINANIFAPGQQIKVTSIVKIK